eukprot:CAMPEP_0115503290 /NCGR_PEP_ID=MMETSP0271-20121206/69394_1 /TAXON_ID=71861 /ORGANISM="Scrippsiella trochoidea, Strain CCMP3099" /LENGTH=169 /DNA_ID=CAMNT_0002932365 /DNA_START=33 /DNA_END=538 /DNA_ORIENTATION=+
MAGNLDPCAGGVCQSPEQAGRGAYSYVGNGKGGYERLQELNYVGDGVGSFDKEEVTIVTGWRLKKASVATAGLLTLVAGVGCYFASTKLLTKEYLHQVGQESPPFLRSALHEPGQPGRRAPRAVVSAAGGIAAAKAIPYNCLEGKEQWKEVWLEAKKEWCCRHEGLGCP